MLVLCRYVRKKIGASMKLRLTPEIRFIYDEANERGERVMHLCKVLSGGLHHHLAECRAPC